MVSKKEKDIIDRLTEADYENIFDSNGKITEFDTRRDEINLNYLKEHPDKVKRPMRKKKSTKTKAKRKKKGCGCPK